METLWGTEDDALQLKRLLLVSLGDFCVGGFFSNTQPRIECHSFAYTQEVDESTPCHRALRSSRPAGPGTSERTHLQTFPLQTLDRISRSLPTRTPMSDPQFRQGIVLRHTLSQLL